ncbi:hypothetical protein WISP_47719 [Willisornis vidua]|uniref:Uncharacterized protein n=1 Tax=Willisornis vidua TaxID=1566151 RepID=A0ABQ9DJV7_9PASS|nr:hypothetical protein WISP_47719 [Willisornis vidua]
MGLGVQLLVWGTRSHWKTSTPKLESGSVSIRDLSRKILDPSAFLTVQAEDQQSHEIPESMPSPGHAQLPAETLGMKGRVRSFIKGVKQPENGIAVLPH